MNLSQIGWIITVVGLVAGMVAVALSMVWHKVDSKQGEALDKAKEFWKQGNKEDGGLWADRANHLIRICVRIRLVGVTFLYLSALLTIFGALLLVIGTRATS